MWSIKLVILSKTIETFQMSFIEYPIFDLLSTIMSKLIFILCLIQMVSMCLFSITTHAQDSLRMYRNSSINAGVTWSTLSVYSNSNSRYLDYSQYFDVGTGGDMNTQLGKGQALGISFEIYFGDPAKTNFSLIGRMSNCTSEVSHSILAEDIEFTIVPSGQIVKHQIYSDTKTTIENYCVDLLVNYTIPNSQFGIQFGPQLWYVKQSNHSMYATLRSDPNYPAYFQFPTKSGTNLLDVQPSFDDFILNYWPRYTDGNRTSIIMYDGELPDTYQIRYSIMFGLQYRLEFFGLHLIPRINYSYGLTPLVGHDTWNVNQLQAGLDFRIDI